MPKLNPIVAIAGVTVVISLAAAATAAPLRATVHRHAIVRTGAPSVRVAVPHSARYVGGERFTLYDNADCELHLFVDADAQKHVRRLYWVQFEEYLRGKPNARYSYGDHDQRTTLWGGTVWVANSFGQPNQSSRPGSDREHVNALLIRAGYVMPAAVMQTRMVRLLDDAADDGHGRRELMLIYSEDLAESGETYQALGGDGEDTARWRVIEPSLAERAAAGFQVSAR